MQLPPYNNNDNNGTEKKNSLMKLRAWVSNCEFFSIKLFMKYLWGKLNTRDIFQVGPYFNFIKFKETLTKY